MYYFDNEIEMALSFTEKEKFAFHFISRIIVDYVNNRTDIELCSYPSKEAFIRQDGGKVTFLAFNDTPRFTVDPNLFALRCLMAVESSPFYRQEIKAWHELEHLTQLPTMFNKEEE